VLAVLGCRIKRIWHVLYRISSKTASQIEKLVVRKPVARCPAAIATICSTTAIACIDLTFSTQTCVKMDFHVLCDRNGGVLTIGRLCYTKGFSKLTVPTFRRNFWKMILLFGLLPVEACDVWLFPACFSGICSGIKRSQVGSTSCRRSAFQWNSDRFFEQKMVLCWVSSGKLPKVIRLHHHPALIILFHLQKTLHLGFCESQFVGVYGH